MDIVHNWALWRLLVVALIALPFLVAVVVSGLRQRHVDGANASAGHDDRNACSPMAGPDAWRKDGSTPLDDVRARDNAVVVEQRAA